jgi:cell division protein ZapD
VTSPIIYEFPLNERIRIFIRLEQLFQQFNHHLQSISVFDKRAAINVLLDIVAIFKRNDLKSEVLKELDRLTTVLNKIAANQNVDNQKLHDLLAQLSELSKSLYATTGKIGNHIASSDLFQSVTQRSTIPGGTCSFDLPEFHFWLMQDDTASFEDLSDWSRPFMSIFEAITLILDFIRQSHVTTEELAPSGFFQITLDSSLPQQLLSVEVERNQPYFVEISGGKHRCTIRFMQPSHDNQRPKQCVENVPFILTRCVI